MSATDVVCCIVFIFAFSIISFLIGHEDGRIGVASGQIKCELIERADKTTEWKCREVSE